MITKFAPVAHLLAATLLLVGCGERAADSSSSTKAETAAKPAAEGRAIAITGNDAMKFSITEITATPGETLSVTLNNIGTMPKFSMGHNWILLRADADIAAFVAQAANAPTTDYVPAGMQDSIIAHTKLLGPKESDTVTFNAPSEPGRYEFICSFPGHFQVGMRGVLIVE